MTRPWLKPISTFAEARDRIAASVPVLKTDRLILRAPRVEDWETLEPIWTTDRAKYIGGPYDEEDAFLDFAQCAASWVLRGIGYWTITRKQDAAVLGICGYGQECGDPEAELGWLLTEAAEGHGYAYEAAAAARNHLLDVGLGSFVSYIDAPNKRSIALAERLGATRDVHLKYPSDDVLTFRHQARGTQK